MSIPATGGLRDPRHRVDPRAQKWWTMQAALGWSGPAILCALVLLALSALFFPGALWWLAPLLAAVIVLPAVTYLVVMPRWRYRVHAWEVGELSVYSLSGWFWQRRRIAPFSRVQTVDTTQGPLQRVFELYTVTVTTASTAGDVRIAGVSEWDAAEIVRRIGRAAEMSEGDGT